MWEEQDLQLLHDSRVFDADWYRQAYPDVVHSGLSPWEHFVSYGLILERCPGPGFDPVLYHQRYADVPLSELAPLVHFLRHGLREQREAPAMTAVDNMTTIDKPLGDRLRPTPLVAVVLHAYHLELLPELLDRLGNISVPFDLFVTTPFSPELAALQVIYQIFPYARVRQVENRGRDIRPFVQLLPELQGYELCLKVHTKQGVTSVAQAWREALLDGVLPGRKGTKKLLAALSANREFKLAGPRVLFLSAHEMMFDNLPWLECLADRLGVSLEADWGFFAGSMFWCRPQALVRLAEVLADDEFEDEAAQQDGGLAHAVERLIGAVVVPQEERAVLLSAKARWQGVTLSQYKGSEMLERRIPTQLFKRKPPAAQLMGDLNLGGQTVIKGWLAERSGDAPRTAVIRIDDKLEFDVEACEFRQDLLDNGIHQGWHAFTLYPPLELLDGQPHKVTLLDKHKGQVVLSRDASWHMNRHFVDLQGYLAHSLTDPFMSRPFREEDKRCLAMMENIADRLVVESQHLEPLPLVSVIMPCYNRRETIGVAVQSVMQQCYEHWELWLIDDGSTDGTREWCEQQARQDARIRVVALEENLGVSHARNQGLGRATGQYIMYLDSDNRWDSRYVAATVGAYARNPEAAALYSGLYHYEGASTEPAGVLFGAFNRALLFNNNYIDLNAFSHTCEVHQQLGGFDETLPRFVDWDLIRRYSLHARVVSVPVVLTHYHIGLANNTITADASLSGFLDQVRENSGSVWDGAVSWSNAVSLSQPLARGISVVIPSYEAATDLRNCLDALFQLGLEEKLEVIVVDNASSSEDVLDTLREEAKLGRIKVLFSNRNYGFTHAVNRGISLANPEHDLLLLNNDALVHEGALEAMQSAARLLPDCGLVVPQQVLPGGTPTMGVHVPYANTFQPCDVNVSQHHGNVINTPIFHDGRLLELSFAPFFCVYISREVYALAGPLDEEFGRHYRSDRIYCDVVRHLLGLKIYHVSDAVVFHKLQKSTRMLSVSSGDDFSLMFKSNQWDEVTRQQLGYRKAAWDV